MSRTTGKMSLSLKHKEQEKAKRIKKKRKRRRIDQFMKRDVDQLLLGELINWRDVWKIELSLVVR
jgi:hypothetical protein